VQIDPDKLHAQHIGLNEIDQALQNWNVNLPTGQLFGPVVHLAHQGQRPVDERRRVQAGGRRVSPRRAGAPDQVANVVDSVENVMNGSWFYTKPGGKPLQQRAITLQVMRQPGSNTIDVTDSVRALLQASNRSCRRRFTSRRVRTGRAPSARRSKTSR
jgi:HAE1 family hydrophobic/amphiphilic exporter-1